MFGPSTYNCIGCSVQFTTWDINQAKKSLCNECITQSSGVKKLKIDFYYFKDSGKWKYEGQEEFVVNSINDFYELTGKLRDRHAANDLPGCTCPSEFRCVAIPVGNDFGYPLSFPPVVKNEKPTIERLQQESLQWAKRQGFWDDIDLKHLDPENLSKQAIMVLAMKLMLVTSELGEAFEELRCGRPLCYEKNGKPEGFGIEIADAVIILSSLAEALRFDLGDMFRQKGTYNDTRPHMNGKVVG